MIVQLETLQVGVHVTTKAVKVLWVSKRTPMPFANLQSGHLGPFHHFTSVSGDHWEIDDLIVTQPVYFLFQGGLLPVVQCWVAAKHLLRYLKGTVALKLVYSDSTSPDHRDVSRQT